MKCINCSKSIPDDSEFCPYCGSTIEKQSKDDSKREVEYAEMSTEMMRANKSSKKKFCKKCGAIIDIEKNKCTGCGKQYLKFTNKKLVVALFLILLIGTVSTGMIIYSSQPLSKSEDITTVYRQSTTTDNYYNNDYGKIPDESYSYYSAEEYLLNKYRPQAEKTWQKVTQFSGNSMTSTQRFTINSNEWRIKWDTSPGKNGNDNFVLQLRTADGFSVYPSLIANIIGAGSSESYIYQAGTFYFEIDTSQNYTIGIEEFT